MSQLREINELNFEAEVLQSDTPFLLDFTAQWCGPCKALSPLLEQLAKENTGKLRVGKLDIDEAPDLVRRFGIRGAPTLLVFRNGREVQRQVGAGNKTSLRALVGPL